MNAVKDDGRIDDGRPIYECKMLESRLKIWIAGAL